MPKKSKREKIRADIRRRAHTEQVPAAPTSSSTIQEHSSTFQFNMTQLAKQKEAVSVEVSSELTAIKKDLIKTMILATIAITGELVLYWFSRGNI